MRLSPSRRWPNLFRRSAAALLSVAIVSAPRPARPQEPTPPAPAPPAAALPSPRAEIPSPGAEIPATARLAGRILRADGKTPDAGAVIRVCSLETDSLAGSAVADAKGEFLVEGLRHGFVEIVVDAADQVFAGNQVVQLAPAERKTVELVLVPGTEAPAAAAGKSPRPSPCSDRPPSGSAQVRARSTTGEFFHSKKGIVLLASAGAAVLLLLASGGGSDETPASPSIP